MTSRQRGATNRHADNKKLIGAGICKDQREADQFRMALKKDGKSVDSYIKARRDDVADAARGRVIDRVLTNLKATETDFQIIVRAPADLNVVELYDMLDQFIDQRVTIKSVETTKGIYTIK